MINKQVLIFLSLLVLLIFAFWGFTGTFFQQDEWQFFGAFIHALASSNPIMNLTLPFVGEITHFYPLSNLFFLTEYLLFKMNFPFYALTSLLWHFLNGILLYILIKKLVKNDLIALGSSAIFLTYSLSHQAVTWVLVSAANLPATFFMLISLIFFINFTDKKDNKYFIISLIFLFISFLFKEISLFLLILYPLFIWFHHSKSSRKTIWFIFAVIFFYITLRGIFFILPIRSDQPEIGNVSSAPLQTYVYRLASLPLKGLTQSIIPSNFLIQNSDLLIRLGYPQFIDKNGSVNPYISQTIVFDLICYFYALVILILVYILYRNLKSQKEILLAEWVKNTLIFILFSFLPFIFIPGKAGYFSIFEPRNLYIASAGISFIIAIFLFSFTKKISKNLKVQHLLFFVALLVIILLHIFNIQNDLSKLEEVGVLRKSFLEIIEKDYPTLPKKVIIFTQSNKPYYGMPEEEKILPIQSGFGRMVMVWYQDKEKFPGCLYEDQFLHDLLSQGYKQCQSRGFGYFRNFDVLKEQIKKDETLINEVIVYNWDGGTEEFKNITQQVRNRLKQELP